MSIEKIFYGVSFVYPNILQGKKLEQKEDYEF